MLHTTFGTAPRLFVAAGVVATVSCWQPQAELSPRQSRNEREEDRSVPANFSLAAVEEASSWIAALRSRSQRVAKLNDGWDGPGSVAISNNVINAATILIERALRNNIKVTLPYLVPGGDGSLQIEWHRKHGELELDMHPDGTISIWGKNHSTGLEFEGDGEEAISHFYRWASWLATAASDARDAQNAPRNTVFTAAA